jgi:hypothetical protein
MLQAGRVRALAVTSAARYSQLPQLPTLTESGIREVKITYEGSVAGLKIKALTASAVAGLLRPLLQEADALGPVPSDPAELLAWRQAQCAINRQLQELQRQFGRPVETARQMGRPPACEQLARQP